MQTILQGSVWIYADSGTRYEIKQENDIFHIWRNGVKNEFVKYEKLSKAISETERWAKSYENKKR